MTRVRYVSAVKYTEHIRRRRGLFSGVLILGPILRSPGKSLAIAAGDKRTKCAPAFCTRAGGRLEDARR